MKTINYLFKSIYPIVFAILLSLFIPSNVHAETDTATITTTIYHKHTGSASGGGCYTVPHTSTRTVEIPCPGSLVYWPALDISTCSSCAASYHGQVSGRCPHSETRSENYTTYSIGCGKNAQTAIGTLSVTPDTTDWCRELHLILSYSAEEGMKVSNPPYTINKQPYSDNQYTVTQNGIYTITLNANANANTAAAAIDININNIDITPPIAEACTITPTDWTREDVLATVLNASDIQPDSSEGCGLSPAAYSYDEGNSWVEQNTHIYALNGTFRIMVRDVLDNISEYFISIDNIDKEPPNITTFEYVRTKQNATLTVAGNDIRSDGTAGIGLDELPFSYDGGKSWTSESSITVTRNTTINFLIRDKLGNTASKTQKVTGFPVDKPPVKPDEPSDDIPDSDDPIDEDLPDAEEVIDDIPPVLPPAFEEPDEEFPLDIEDPKPTPVVTIIDKPVINSSPKTKPVQQLENLPETNNNFLSRLLICLFIALLFILLFVLLFLYSRTVLVFANENDKNNLKGLLFIHIKDKNHYITFPQRILDTCSSPYLILSFNFFHIALHKNHETEIILPYGESIFTKPQRAASIKL